MDKYNYTSLNNPRARNVVLEMIIQNSLIDVWWEMNVEKREYTWFRRNPIKKARLDYFLISESLFAEVDESCIYPGYRTDHSMIMMQLQLGKFLKGRSYLKMNNSLLKDHQYVTEIKSIILEVKSRYAVNNQNPNISFTDIPNNELFLSVNEQLFWETLLLEIRGKTIAYSSFKKRQEIGRESQLLKEIKILEKQQDINFEEYERKKTELQEIRHTKMEGAKVRSRAKWLNEGEKPTNYFCNLENHNFMSKTMNCLLSSAGNVLKSQSEVLKEVELFYHLYSYREVDQVNLEDILHNGNHKKLNDNMKEYSKIILHMTKYYQV